MHRIQTKDWESMTVEYEELAALCAICAHPNYYHDPLPCNHRGPSIVDVCGCKQFMQRAPYEDVPTAKPTAEQEIVCVSCFHAPHPGACFARAGDIHVHCACTVAHAVLIREKRVATKPVATAKPMPEPNENALCFSCQHEQAIHDSGTCVANTVSSVAKNVFGSDAYTRCGCKNFLTENQVRSLQRDFTLPASIVEPPKPNGAALKGTFTVPGVGADAPKITLEGGGEQSFVPYRFDLIDERALFALARILDYGARERGYGEHNWRLISVNQNLNHALVHIFAFLAGDTQDDHLEHAFTRVHFALGVHLRNKELPE